VFRYAPPSKAILSSEHTLNGLKSSAATGLKQPREAILKVEIIGWSLKLDHLDVIPRVFEDVVILVELGSDTNRFQLLYLQRSPIGGSKGEPWLIPSYPPLCRAPIALKAVFERMPTEKEISEFIRASDFGCNNFDPIVRVVDVVLYRRSQLIGSALIEGIPEAEKQRRHAEHDACFFEEF
jgi:hypothetical protein